jgi:hypothetical protein
MTNKELNQPSEKVERELRQHARQQCGAVFSARRYNKYYRRNLKRYRATGWYPSWGDDAYELYNKLTRRNLCECPGHVPVTAGYW